LIRELACLEIVVDFWVAVFSWFSLLVFSVFDGCFYLEWGILGWFVSFPDFSLMVNPVLSRL